MVSIPLESWDPIFKSGGALLSRSVDFLAPVTHEAFTRCTVTSHSRKGGDRVRDATKRAVRSLLLGSILLVGVLFSTVAFAVPALATDTSTMTDLILDFIPIILLLAILGMMIGMFSKFGKGFGGK